MNLGHKKDKDMELKQPLKLGDEIEIEICPTEGQYEATTTNGQPFVEKFSLESLKEVVENWGKDGHKPILCDIDHSSVDKGNTGAAGWVLELRVDEDAKRLKGTLVISDKGAELLNGLEYRYISPVLLFRDDNYPYYLDSVSLTNTPRITELKPVYNSKNPPVQPAVQNLSNHSKNELDGKAVIVDNGVNESGKPEQKQEPVENVTGTGTDTKTEKVETSMEEIKVILGLPAEATEEDILNSVKELVDKVKAIADEEIKAEAEEAVNECGIEDERKEEVINCYKQNPQLVKSVLNAFKAKPAKLVINSAEAVKPGLTEDEKLKAEYATLRGGKEKRDWLIAHPGVKL